MHTLELLEEALAVASRLGIKVRHDWLGERGGGVCELRGQKWIFLDTAQSPLEHFALVTGCLRAELAVARMEMSTELRRHLEARKSA